MRSPMPDRRTQKLAKWWSHPLPHCKEMERNGRTYPCSVLLVAVRVVDELPVELLGLLCVELLAAIRALECSIHLDANVLSGAVSGLCRITDFQRLRHRGSAITSL